MFRISRGTTYIRYAEIEDEDNHLKDPESGLNVPINVFIVFYRGKQFEDKIIKAFEAYNAHYYKIPRSSEDRQNLLEEARGRKDDMDTVLNQTVDKRKEFLVDIATRIIDWAQYTRNEKAVYDSLNLMNYDKGRKCLIAEGWAPVSAKKDIESCLKKAKKKSNSRVPPVLYILESNETPPTYFNTNKFTRAFQAIVNAYGTPRYQEINPTPFTIITYPFLFGVMFGDVGHGLILLAIALSLIYFEQRISLVSNEIVKMIYQGRFVLLFMSIFSIYMGSLYNECFSVVMDMGSSWVLKEDNYTWVKSPAVYKFGIDPVWRYTDTTLLFYNSLKMKMAIIFGVLQMTLGLFLKLLNSIHFGHGLDIVFEFIPQMCFLMGIFGYLCFLIFVKWTIGTGTSPLLLNVLINMIIPGSSAGTYFFPGQKTAETVLVLAALISIPVMLIPKPIIIGCMYSSWKKKHLSIWHSISENEEEKGSSDNKSGESHKEKDIVSGGEDSNQVNLDVDEYHSPSNKKIGGFPVEDFKMSEILVHQILETIEFVLGTVSHTASYLRLWALSLAHSELSLVLWEMLFSPASALGAKLGIPALSGVGAFIGFAVWMALTFFILCFMEALSAALHSLRLHWVEFQSKFYRGDGQQFKPLYYKKIVFRIENK